MCIYVLDFSYSFFFLNIYTHIHTHTHTHTHTREIMHWWYYTIYNTMPYMEAPNKYTLTITN